MNIETASPAKVPWNKGKIVGQKAPLKLKDIWAIRIRLQLGHRTRELALFDLGLDSKLRACDSVRLRERTSATVIAFPLKRSSCSKKPDDLFSLKLHR